MNKSIKSKYIVLCGSAHIFFSIFFFIIIFVSCQNPATFDIGNQEDMSFDDFCREYGFVPFQSGFMYEGDLLFSAECVKQKYDDFSNGTRGFRDKNYPWAKKNYFSYKFTSDMATGELTDSEVRNAFRTAAQAWMSDGIVTFFEVFSGASDITIETIRQTTHPVTGKKYNAFTGQTKIPNKGYVFNKIFINLTYIDDMYDTSTKMVGCLSHELGHVLGLFHEHQREEADNDDRDGEPVIGYSSDYVGPYDPDSVMNYRNRPYVKGISDGDKAAIRRLHEKKRNYIFLYQDKQNSVYSRGEGMTILDLNYCSDLPISSISAIEFGEDFPKNIYAVVMWSRDDYKGSHIVVSSSIMDLSTKDFNDRCDSISFVAYPFVGLYKDKNYKDDANIVLTSCPDLSLSGISSAKLYKKPNDYSAFSAELFDKKNYGGKTVFVTSEIPDLRSKSFNDKCNSIKVYK